MTNFQEMFHVAARNKTYDKKVIQQQRFTDRNQSDQSCMIGSAGTVMFLHVSYIFKYLPMCDQSHYMLTGG